MSRPRPKTAAEWAQENGKRLDLVEAYAQAFNETQSFTKAAKRFNASPQALWRLLRYHGYVITKTCAKPDPAAPACNDTGKATACVCGETSSRNCPVHQNEEATACPYDCMEIDGVWLVEATPINKPCPLHGHGKREGDR